MPIIQSVDRALKILDLFNEYETELKITEISEKMNLHKSTVHSLLKTLQAHRYIEQDQESGKYRLGMKLFERGNLVVQTIDIATVAKPHLNTISKETQQTVHLVILDGKEGVYIDKVEGVTTSSLYSRIGRRIPIHCSAVGKALVAYKASGELDSLLENYDFEKRTEYTITDKEAYLRELAEVREQGYAHDNQENEQGVNCVAIPIQNYAGDVVAAMSISSPVMRYNDEEMSKHISILKREAGIISKKLGYGIH
ncbi:IclR family transcriptional regulator [Schinkia azotoformans]|uniref:IclR family transcriptional regulator n=1 Tax=Schinkia azotoformans TaxID=1454 RepID=UPI002DB76AB6|nr:IclR family transcriptional regulator [Schinkia azotoformans]MEC1715027.1 IclR family transcriptional regulator [Schinkia azotoformans]MEC1740261.1 IclR family transcriptional regulator [Schinkia azotoformans]MEC1746901.1 IclR family transcriptional regulator [Schinkia azotoformans]MEC1766148.1 IclR family transcriptional regulator [Schinkia azotoformans]MEC1770549.1 IclR family transcriptional regulator [Schinkia azotoformans]